MQVSEKNSSHKKTNSAEDTLAHCLETLRSKSCTFPELVTELERLQRAVSQFNVSTPTHHAPNSEETFKLVSSYILPIHENIINNIEAVTLEKNWFQIIEALIHHYSIRGENNKESMTREDPNANFEQIVWKYINSLISSEENAKSQAGFRLLSHLIQKNVELFERCERISRLIQDSMLGINHSNPVVIFDVLKGLSAFIYKSEYQSYSIFKTFDRALDKLEEILPNSELQEEDLKKLLKVYRYLSQSEQSTKERYFRRMQAILKLLITVQSNYSNMENQLILLTISKRFVAFFDANLLYRTFALAEIFDVLFHQMRIFLTQCKSLEFFNSKEFSKFLKISSNNIKKIYNKLEFNDYYRALSGYITSLVYSTSWEDTMACAIALAQISDSLDEEKFNRISPFIEHLQNIGTKSDSPYQILCYLIFCGQFQIDVYEHHETAYVKSAMTLVTRIFNDVDQVDKQILRYALLALNWLYTMGLGCFELLQPEFILKKLLQMLANVELAEIRGDIMELLDTLLWKVETNEFRIPKDTFHNIFDKFEGLLNYCLQDDFPLKIQIKLLKRIAKFEDKTSNAKLAGKHFVKIMKLPQFTQPSLQSQLIVHVWREMIYYYGEELTDFLGESEQQLVFDLLTDNIILQCEALLNDQLLQRYNFFGSKKELAENVKKVTEAIHLLMNFGNLTSKIELFSFERFAENLRFERLALESNRLVLSGLISMLERKLLVVGELNSFEKNLVIQIFKKFQLEIEVNDSSFWLDITGTYETLRLVRKMLNLISPTETSESFGSVFLNNLLEATVLFIRESDALRAAGGLSEIENSVRELIQEVLLFWIDISRSKSPNIRFDDNTVIMFEKSLAEIQALCTQRFGAMISMELLLITVKNLTSSNFERICEGTKILKEFRQSDLENVELIDHAAALRLAIVLKTQALSNSNMKEDKKPLEHLQEHIGWALDFNEECYLDVLRDLAALSEAYEFNEEFFYEVLAEIKTENEIYLAQNLLALRRVILHFHRLENRSKIPGESSKKLQALLKCAKSNTKDHILVEALEKMKRK